MSILCALVVGVVVFRAVWWLGGIWVTGAEVLDEHTE